MVDRLDTGFSTANFTPATVPTQAAASSTVSVDTGNTTGGPATVSMPLSLIAMLQAVRAALTALAGGAKAGATQLGYGFNQVSVVATAADSVLLPPAVAGAWCFVRNSAANAMQVFGSGTDTINDVATATGVSQAATSGILYACLVGTGDGVAGKWYRT